MNAYDPDTSSAAIQWLELDESERIELVAAYHRRKKIRLPNAQLHAVIHVVVENQVALGEEVVVNTLARLQAEGLSRHEALHAIGSVLAEDLYELMREPAAGPNQAYARYLDRLGALTAEDWRAG
jgi:hypothetical protein